MNENNQSEMSIEEPVNAGEGEATGGNAKKERGTKKRLRIVLRDRDNASATQPEEGEYPVVKVSRSKGLLSHGRREPFLLIIAICGAVGLVVGVSLAIILNYTPPTPEELLEKADSLYADAKYSRARSTYEKLLKYNGDEPVDKELTVSAYLGLSETYLAKDKVDAAVDTLEVGVETVRDQRLSSRLEELLDGDWDAQPLEEEEAGEESPEEIPMSLGESDIPLPVPDATVFFPEGTDFLHGEALLPTPIIWQDAAFERMVRQALGVGAGEPIYQKDLTGISTLKIIGGTHASVNDSLNAVNKLDSYTIDGVTYTERGDIRSLADAAHFRNLTKLTVCYNRVEDLSGLENLTQLNTLGLYCNEIVDLYPLRDLTGLQFLYLYNNQIEDLSPIAGSTDLRQLWVQHNGLVDLSPIAGMDQLRELFVGDNQLADITPVERLHNLRYFYANNNEIRDIRVVEGMSSLTDISFSGNPVSDYSPAAKVTNVNLPLAGAT